MKSLAVFEKQRKNIVNIVNLTPHDIRLRRNDTNKLPEPDSGDLVIPPRMGADGKPWAARVGSTPGDREGAIEGVSIFGRTIFGAVEGLPGVVFGTVYIVSSQVAVRPDVAGRNDVFVPGTGPKDGAVRTADGQIFAVTRLVRA